VRLPHTRPEDPHLTNLALPKHPILPHSNYIGATKGPTQGRATAPNIPLKALAHCKESRSANMKGSSEQSRAPPIPKFSYSTNLTWLSIASYACSLRSHSSRTKRSQDTANSTIIPLRALTHHKNPRLANMDGWSFSSLTFKKPFLARQTWLGNFKASYDAHSNSTI